MFNVYTILALSLFLIPLIGSVIISPLISIPNAHQMKEFLIIISSLWIILLRFLKCYNTEYRIRKHNYFLYFTLFLIILSNFQAPQIHLLYGAGDLGNLWIWASSFWVLLYLMLYLSLLAYEANYKERKFMILAIGLTAIISAGYAYLQAIGLDQIQYTKHNEIIGNPRAKDICAMLGNPTYLGVFLCMCLPHIWLNFKKKWSLFVCGAILLTQSAFAIGGLVFYGVIILYKRAYAQYKVYVYILALLMLALSFYVIKSGHVSDNGRFDTWKQAIHDIRHPSEIYPINQQMTPQEKNKAYAMNQRNYSWTGKGLGSLPFIFGRTNKSDWENAHGEYIEMPYVIGLFGLIGFVMSLYFVLINSYLPKNKFSLACYLSLIYSIIAMVGIPIIHDEVLRHLAAFNFIMLSSEIAQNKNKA